MKYKLNAFYFLLGNIEPKYRASLDIINLAILCHSNLLKEYGFSKVLEPLLKDLQKLETEGVDVTFENRSYKLYGSISMVIVDNLAAHCLGGFFENFSTVERVCRHCNCQKMRSSINLMRIILLFAQKRFMINKLKQFLKIQSSVPFLD